MTSQLSLYNNALLLCEERALSSLTEAREPRRLLDTVWAQPAVDRCLQAGQWKFALRSAELSPSPSVTPAFGYTHAFDRPTDLMRTTGVCTDPYLAQPLLAYQTEGAYFYADTDPLYVQYVSNDASYGGDLSLWPPNFAAYVEAYLANEIASRLTADQRIRQDVAMKLKDRLNAALSTDAMESPTRMHPEGSWVSARRGALARGDRGPTNRLTG
jgi:hypothetical protein